MATFFGGETIRSAFVRANNKQEIVNWFNEFKTDPDNFQIKLIHQPSMKNAAKAIEDFSKLPKSPSSTEPYFGQKGNKIVAPEIIYEGLAHPEIKIGTLFDVVGWVLSVVGKAPGPPESEAHREGYYYPLVALYAVICRTLTSKAKEPDKIQVTWFQLKIGNKNWHVALGASLDSPSDPALKGDLKDERKTRLCKFGTPPEYDVKKQVDYGYCAETLPFMFLKEYLGSVEQRTIGGIAVLPNLILKDGPEFDKEKFQPVERDGHKAALVPPCEDRCTHLIKHFFRGALVQRFDPPYTS